MDSIQFVKRQGGGQVGINRFPSGGMKAIWIAAFTMFIIWLLGLILAPIANKVFSKDGKPGGMARMVNNFARAARDAFLILLTLAVVTQAGHGASPGVIVLQWIIFALLCLWILVQAFLPHWWWLEMLSFLPAAVLSVINFALAFRNAPSYRS